MADAAERFGVPIVGGHLHPNTPYNVIDVAILGSAALDFCHLQRPCRGMGMQ